MAIKKPVLKVINTDTGEIKEDFDDLLQAKDIISARLAKTVARKVNIEADIDSMVLSLELIEQKLVAGGYEPE